MDDIITYLKYKKLKNQLLNLQDNINDNIGICYIKHDSTGELYRIGIDDTGIYAIKQTDNN